MEAVINLLPKQTEAWEAFEDPAITELGYGGGAGGGKTRLGWYIGITISEQYPGSRGAVGRKELKTLRITTLAELWVIFAEMGYQTGKDYSYDAKDSIIKFANGSEILLLDTAYSPQDPEYTRFGSLNLTWAWIEESNETPEKAKNILKTRVGRQNVFTIDGKRVEVKPFWLETFNPNKGHVHRDYYKPWKEGNLPGYRRFIRALPGDNPYLPKSYIENLRRADKTTRERLLYGNFDYSDDPFKLFQYDAITELVDNPVVEKKPTKLIVADIARFGGDKIVIGTFNGKILFGLGVYTYQGTDETSKKIRIESVEEQIPYSNILIDEDGIGGGVVDQMPGVKGFTGNSSPTTYHDDITGKIRTENFQNFRSQCYFKLAEMVNNHYIAVKITKFKTNIEGYTQEKALSDLFEELDQTKRKDDTTGGKLAVIPKAEIKEQLGRSPDFGDVLMMRMFFEFKEPYQEPGYVPRQTKVKINRAR
jgi:phage terminase large subunit